MFKGKVIQYLKSKILVTPQEGTGVYEDQTKLDVYVECKRCKNFTTHLVPLNDFFTMTPEVCEFCKKSYDKWFKMD